ncbi:COMM domain-containing protein 6 isoform X2 [Maylandia zebra]|uniref:COMM domain-containing protein 6 isoform X2 n=1 Tax=Maylandia zebra TaxID=106582 RepID=UPI000647F6FE
MQDFSRSVSRCGQLERATSLGMNLCQSWKKALPSGPKLPFRSCISCGVNMVCQSTLNKRPRPCLASLVDMQWKLGMAVSSDTCRSLNSPFVCLLLKIVEPSGQICQRSFEMTIPQFQNFYKQFKEMAAVMETV